jgi:hypothetical protein
VRHGEVRREAARERDQDQIDREMLASEGAATGDRDDD